MPLTNAQTVHALRRLGILPEDIREVRRASSLEGGRAALQELQAKAKKAFKVLARELHPDVTGGDAEKEEEFKVILSVVEDLMRLEVRQRPLPQPVSMNVTFVQHGYYGGYHGTSTTSSASAWPSVTVRWR